jgi:hypothetical protein
MLDVMLREISAEYYVNYNPIKRLYCVGWEYREFEGNNLDEVCKEALKIWPKENVKSILKLRKPELLKEG